MNAVLRVCDKSSELGLNSWRRCESSIRSFSSSWLFGVLSRDKSTSINKASSLARDCLTCIYDLLKLKSGLLGLLHENFYCGHCVVHVYSSWHPPPSLHGHWTTNGKLSRPPLHRLSTGIMNDSSTRRTIDRDGNGSDPSKRVGAVSPQILTAQRKWVRFALLRFLTLHFEYGSIPIFPR